MVTRKDGPIGKSAFRVHLRAPRAADQRAFLGGVEASRATHAGWVAPPSTPELFATLVRRYGRRGANVDQAGYLVVRNEDEALVGAFNFSQIVRGALQCSHLGYYAFAPFTGQGLMAEGFVLALDAAFGDLALHRVEVNVRPDNDRSLALVNRVGFEREGYSRRFVKIAGRWRDHIRFAMLAEDWPLRRRHLLASLRLRSR